MAKSKVELKVIDGETPNSKIFVLSQNIKGFSLYDRAKAIHKFIGSETKVLEQALDNHLRQILIQHDIVPQDGSDNELQIALFNFKARWHKEFEIRNRYIDTKETIVGEQNQMTVIEEEGILSCAIEIEVVESE